MAAMCVTRVINHNFDKKIDQLYAHIEKQIPNLSSVLSFSRTKSTL